MATWPTALSPLYERPYVFSADDNTVIEDYGGPEQRYYKSIFIEGTAENGTSDSALVDTDAFDGYTTAGLQMAKVAVIDNDRDAYYSVTTRTDASNLVIAKIYGTGGFTLNDTYTISVGKMAFELTLRVNNANRQKLWTWWLYHKRYKTLTWIDRYESSTWTVRFMEKPQIIRAAPAVWEATVNFIEVI